MQLDASAVCMLAAWQCERRLRISERDPACDTSRDNLVAELRAMTASVEKRFQCPLCGCTSYEAVVIYRPGHPPYQLPLSACCGCSVTFRDPWQFTAQRPGGYQVTKDAREGIDPRGNESVGMGAAHRAAGDASGDH